MSEATHPNWAVYDLGRLVKNLSEVRRRAGPGKKIFAAIKGNAYGHGALAVAQALEGAGVEGFMTGSYEEACLLRNQGLTTPIVLFAGALPEGMGGIVAQGLIPTIVSRAGAEAAAAAATDEAPADVYVKIDMGLGRLGVAAEDAEAFLAALSDLPGLHVAGLYTHLPFPDQAGCDWARARYAAFDGLLERLAALGRLPPITQAGASSSLAAAIEDRANSVCVGHLLYGLSPFSAEPVGDIAAFQPLLVEIGSRLIQVTAHRQGADLMIAGAYGIRAGRRIGVAPIGAANGIQRPVPGSRPTALVRGARVPIIAVTLEHLVLDLDTVAEAEAGDRVLLLGEDGDTRIDLQEFAGWSGLSCLDSVLAISARLPARYRNGP